MIFYYLDILLFLFCTYSTFYLFVFVLASFFYKKRLNKEVKGYKKIKVLLPAYKEDELVKRTLTNLLAIEYPKERFDIVVIADHFKQETIEELRELPIILLTPQFKSSSKGKAMKYAMKETKDIDSDVTVILDADNVVDTDFLSRINSLFNDGKTKVIQAHRTAKNKNTDVAILDALSEEINNTIFRKGQNALGFSSQLIGSGIAMESAILEDAVNYLKTAGEDKELAIYLLRKNIFVEYVSDLLVYDEKTDCCQKFKKQRKRWLASQLDAIIISSHDFTSLIRNKNMDYLNTFLHFFLLPRSILVLFVLGVTVIHIGFDVLLFYKWLGLFAIIILSLLLAIPKHLRTRRTAWAILKFPKLALMMIVNLFSISRKTNKEYLHTREE